MGVQYLALNLTDDTAELDVLACGDFEEAHYETASQRREKTFGGARCRILAENLLFKCERAL